MHSKGVFIHKLMGIGVNGVLNKSSEPNEVEQTLYSTINPKSDQSKSIIKLTNREMEILLLICREFTPGEISQNLQISEKTFFNHRSSIIMKTNSRNNVGLMRFALQRGYFKWSE